MYHTIKEFCDKIDLIKEKSETLRNQQHRASTSPAQTQFEIDDIRALCADIVNDTGTE